MRQKKIQKLEKRQRKFSRQLEEKDSKVAELSKELKLRNGQIKTLLSSVKSKDERNLQLQKSLKEAEDIVSDGILDAQDLTNSPVQRRLNRSLKSSQEQVANLNGQLKAARRLADIQRQDTQKLQHKVNKQGTDLLHAEKEVESLRKQLEDSTAVRQIALRRQEPLLGPSSATRDMGTTMMGSMNPIDADIDQVEKSLLSGSVERIKKVTRGIESRQNRH